MRRFLIITVGVIGVFIAITMISTVILFNTTPGRQIITTQIESYVGDALASDVEIASMTGAPPGRIILNDISLAGPDGQWLTVKRIELRWRPLAYLAKKIEIDRLTIDGAHLFRRPPDTEEPEDDEGPFLIKLSDDLPSVNITNMTLSNISTDINGETERISGTGALQMKARRVKANIELVSTNDRDVIDISIDLDPGMDKLIIDATLEARAEGAIAALAGLDGDLSFTANNDDPLSTLDVKFAGQLGDYGALEGTLTNGRMDSSTIDINVNISPGGKFAETPELAGVIAAKMRLENHNKGGALTIDTMTLSAGEISGALAWRNKGSFVNQMNVELSAVFATDYRPELQETAGSQFSMTGQLDRKGARYGVGATLAGEGGAFSIANGETDLRKKLSGDISFTLFPIEGLQTPLTQRFDLTARLNADLDQDLAFEALSIELEDGSSAHGTAHYSFDRNSIALTADAAATPAAISKIAPSFSATGDVTAEIDLSGTLDQLTLHSVIETPTFQNGEQAVPPLTINIALAGLPSLPTGEINARTANKNLSGSFATQLRSSQNGRISLPVIAYQGAGFQLDGAASYDPGAHAGDINLIYAGDGTAHPWPGFALSGDIKIDGTVSPAESKLTAVSNNLQSGELSARTLSLNADGPLNALRVSINSGALSTKQTGPITQFSAAAVADLAEATMINLTALEGVIGGSRAHLTAPAKIDFSNGVMIENFRLADGGHGTIAIDGAFSQTRWQATAGLSEVNIPHADGTVTLNLDLDTDATTMANGDFQLRSLLTAGREATIGGVLIWNGQSLRVASAEDSDAIDMEIIVPARLLKSPSLNIDTGGALDGYIRYNGDIRAMAPYLPHTLQSLEGALSADFTLSGLTAAPELSGEANFSDGKFTELQSGFSLTGLHVEATARHDGESSAIQFTGGAHGAGQSQGDTVALSGSLAMGGQSSLNLAVLLNDAELSAAPVTSARLNGRIDIVGSLDEINATGAITVEELDAEIITPESTGLVDIEVIAYDGAAPPDAIVAQTRKVLTDFEITIAADDRIFIRGRGLESEWSANVTAVNTRSGPLIIGDMNLQRGALDFSGRRFDIVRGVIAFDRFSANNPRLDIRAEYKTNDGLTAIIAVSGRADEPTVELLSTPAMPSENVMALVLFGKPAEELSAVESLQTAQALAALGGIGPFGGEGITGALRQAVGLDLLNFDIDPENGGGSLTVGKYVADGFFVSATQDIQGQTGSVRVEYEVIENLTIETEIKQDGDQTVSANWKRDF